MGRAPHHLGVATHGWGSAWGMRVIRGGSEGWRGELKGKEVEERIRNKCLTRIK